MGLQQIKDAVYFVWTYPYTDGQILLAIGLLVFLALLAGIPIAVAFARG